MAGDDEVVEMKQRKRGGCRHNNQIMLAREGVNRKFLLARRIMAGVDGVRPNDATIKQSNMKIATAREKMTRIVRARGREEEQ